MAFRFNPFTATLDFYKGGFVRGPSSATDNAIARYDGTTGDLIQNSIATVQDSGAVNAQGFISNRVISNTTSVGANETWIAPSLEIASGGTIVMASGAQLIII